MGALAISLSVLGGFLESAGLILVAHEIAADRKRARDLFPPAQDVRPPERNYPPKLFATGRNPLAQFERPQPGQLEEQMGRGLTTLANGIIQLRKAVDAQLDSSVEALRREAEQREAEIRGHLGYVLAGSIRERVIGVVLLLAGIAFAVAGAVIGTLA